MKYFLFFLVLLCVGAFGLWRFFSAVSADDEEASNEDDQWWIG